MTCETRGKQDGGLGNPDFVSFKAFEQRSEQIVGVH